MNSPGIFWRRLDDAADEVSDAADEVANGVTDGIADGGTDGAADGVTNGAADGVTDGAADVVFEGAADGAGLGTRFLGHIERCKVLLHLVDGTAEDVAADYLTVKSELDAYESDLTQTSRRIVGTQNSEVKGQIASVFYHTAVGPLTFGDHVVLDLLAKGLVLSRRR